MNGYPKGYIKQDRIKFADDDIWSVLCVCLRREEELAQRSRNAMKYSIYGKYVNTDYTIRGVRVGDSYYRPLHFQKTNMTR